MNQIKSVMKHPQAIDYFGGKKLAFEIICQRIAENRKYRSEFTRPEELGAVSALTNPSLVTDLEEGKACPEQFAAEEISLMSAQLGLPLEQLLPMQSEPSDEEAAYWDSQRYMSKEEDHPDKARKFRRLFLTMKALEELFTKKTESVLA